MLSPSLVITTAEYYIRSGDPSNNHPYSNIITRQDGQDSRIPPRLKTISPQPTRTIYRSKGRLDYLFPTYTQLMTPSPSTTQLIMNHPEEMSSVDTTA